MLHAAGRRNPPTGRWKSDAGRWKPFERTTSWPTKKQTKTKRLRTEEAAGEQGNSSAERSKTNPPTPLLPRFIYLSLSLSLCRSLPLFTTWLCLTADQRDRRWLARGLQSRNDEANKVKRLREAAEQNRRHTIGRPSRTRMAVRLVPGRFNRQAGVCALPPPPPPHPERMQSPSPPLNLAASSPSPPTPSNHLAGSPIATEKKITTVYQMISKQSSSNLKLFLPLLALTRSCNNYSLFPSYHCRILIIKKFQRVL